MSAVINCMMDGLDTYESTYPLFPADNDTSNYANELRTVVAIIERWLYSQGYFYQNYYRIPTDIARFISIYKLHLALFDAVSQSNTVFYGLFKVPSRSA